MFAAAPVKDRRRGLTLVELLVVITILTVVTAATIPIMAPATGPRRQREAARLVSTAFSSAQALAIASGRTAGIWIERDQTSPYAATTLYTCDVPPPYSGDISTATAQVARMDSPVPATPFTFYRVEIPTNLISDGMFRVGDQIQFNNQGHIYTIHAGNDSNGDGFIDDPPDTPSPTPAWFVIKLPKQHTSPDPWLNPPTNSLPNPHYENVHPDASDPFYRASHYTPFPMSGTRPLLNYSVSMKFQIFRQPQRSKASPVRLPEGAVIDLRWSGEGDDYGGRVESGSEVWSQRGPVLVMFSPQGHLDSIFTPAGQRTPINSLHFLVGKRERILDGTLPTSMPTDEEELHNFQDMDNFWMTVQRGNGLAASYAVASVQEPTPFASDVNIRYRVAVASTRRLAQQSRTAGGQ